MADGQGGGLRARSSTQFIEDLADVVAHGFFSQGQINGDRAVTFSLGDEGEDAFLLPVQLIKRSSGLAFSYRSQPV